MHEETTHGSICKSNVHVCMQFKTLKIVDFQSVRRWDNGVKCSFEQTTPKYHKTGMLDELIWHYIIFLYFVLIEIYRVMKMVL